MAAKSIVDIQINDGPFRDFYEIFQKYQKQLEGMPDDWKKVVDVIGEGGDEMGGFAKSSKSSKEFLMIAAIQADAISKAMARATGVQDKFNTKAKDGAIQMSRMSKFSKEMHKSISGMSTILLKLGTAGVGGIGSALGAVYGATNMLAGQNLQARGLGLKIGQTQAFDANFEKFGLGTSDLGNVANAQSDVSKQRAFLAAGLTPEQIQNEDVEQLTFDFARKASGKYKEWQKAGMPAASMAQAYGFTDILSQQQLRTGASYSDADWQKAQEKEIADAKKNAVNQKDADAASDVKAQLKSDWAEVQNRFNESLAKAGPDLLTLGAAATKAAIAFAGFIDKQVAPVLHEITTGTATPKGSPDYTWADKAVDWAHGTGAGKFIDQQLLGGGALEAGRKALATMTDPLSGMLNAQLQTESSGGKHNLSRKGAMGPYQFMPDTWKQWGNGGDVNSMQDSRAAAQRYDTFLMKHYGGDLRKTLAAYNWGMGNVDNDINGYTDKSGAYHKPNGANWESRAPKETQKYVKDNINIMITNSTTANVATSMNAAPH